MTGETAIRCGDSPSDLGARILGLPTLSPSPQATGSESISRGRPKSLASLMAEDGRIELHRVSARLAAYKAVSTPNGLHLPCQKADAVRRHRLTKAGVRDQDRTGGGALQTRCLTNLATRTLAALLTTVSTLQLKQINP